MVDKTKKLKKPKKPKQNKKIKKYIGRDNIKDKSIKININTGGKSSNTPPSVQVYPQQQYQPIQHLIHDRNDKTPLIEDKSSQNNLLLFMTQRETNNKIDGLLK